MTLKLKQAAMDPQIPMYIEMPWDYHDAFYFYSSLSP